MKSIIIIGNYGKYQKLNGQTMRTRTIYNSIKAKYGNNYKIEKIDTANKSILLYIKAVFKILKAKRVIILPAKRALKPLLILIKLLGASKKTVHIAIGGWLDTYINKPKWIKIEKNFKAILVQIEALKISLEKLELKNVIYFPNYRENTDEKIQIKEKEDLYKKFVFYSRVIKEKGIFEAIEAIKLLNKEGFKCSLDIYGPLENNFKNEFLLKINNIENIKYHGILKPGEIITTLNKYDALLFPTYYKGEGFPGSILESFMAGVPVIASNWKYNSQIVEENKTGLICKVHSVNSIIECIKKLNLNFEEYKNMPLNCKKEAEKYSQEKIEEILFKALEINK